MREFLVFSKIRRLLIRAIVFKNIIGVFHIASGTIDWFLRIMQRLALCKY